MFESFKACATEKVQQTQDIFLLSGSRILATERKGQLNKTTQRKRGSVCSMLAITHGQAYWQQSGC